jgi:hypothetical protein
MAHVLEWERHHGPVPDGYEVHHKDLDKQNNDISNLELVDDLTHKRLHSGCTRTDDGGWLKPCGVCGELKRIDSDNWYLSLEGWPLYGRCRPCHVRKVVADKQRRRAKVLLHK